MANIALVAITYEIVTELPKLIAGALFFLTPRYFLTSIWASARDRVIYFAMIFGLVLGLVFHQIVPEFDILVAGLVGGTLAFLADRLIPVRPGADIDGGNDTGQSSHS